MNIANVSGDWGMAGGVDGMSGASGYTQAADSGVSTMRNAIQQQSQNFQDLRTSLQTDNLSGAQGAFTTLQQQIQTASQSIGGKSLFDTSSPIGSDFQAIGSSLSTGDINGAQAAFASFVQDLRGAKHQSADASSASSASTSAGSTGLDVLA